MTFYDNILIKFLNIAYYFYFLSPISNKCPCEIIPFLQSVFNVGSEHVFITCSSRQHISVNG